jgi:hypothetical protein
VVSKPVDWIQPASCRSSDMLRIFVITTMHKRRPVKEKIRFDPRLVIVGFMVRKEKMDQVFLGLMRLSPFNIIPPTLHTDLLYLRKTSG